jgi:hypothetical protein
MSYPQQTDPGKRMREAIATNVQPLSRDRMLATD